MATWTKWVRYAQDRLAERSTRTHLITAVVSIAALAGIALTDGQVETWIMGVNALLTLVGLVGMVLPDRPASPTIAPLTAESFLRERMELAARLAALEAQQQLRRPASTPPLASVSSTPPLASVPSTVATPASGWGDR